MTPFFSLKDATAACGRENRAAVKHKGNSDRSMEGEVDVQMKNENINDK